METSTKTLADFHPEAAKYLRRDAVLSLYAINEASDQESKRFEATFKHVHLIEERKPLAWWVAECGALEEAEAVSKILRQTYTSKESALHIEVSGRSGAFTVRNSPSINLWPFVADGNTGFKPFENATGGFEVSFATYID